MREKRSMEPESVRSVQGKNHESELNKGDGPCSSQQRDVYRYIDLRNKTKQEIRFQ